VKMNGLPLLQNRLAEYACKNQEEELNVIRETFQEMILCGLARTDFFVRAAFHGGTQLRIFEGLRRFSEDLDFALLAPDRDFSLADYLNSVARELAAVGVELTVKDRSKADSTVKKAFLKNDSLVRMLELKYVGRKGTLGTPRSFLIKLEVDSNPPAGASYASDQLLFPFPVTVRNFDRASSFSGKLHALLCRTYVKGRDWFDLTWYAAMRTLPNHDLLTHAIDQQGQWAGQHQRTSDGWVRKELLAVIDRMDWNAVRRDVLPFVYASDRPSVELWGQEFFKRLVEKMPWRD